MVSYWDDFGCEGEEEFDEARELEQKFWKRLNNVFRGSSGKASLNSEKKELKIKAGACWACAGKDMGNITRSVTRIVWSGRSTD